MKKTANELISNPLYQVNLVLWMVQPSTQLPIKPILHQAGYRLHDIEPELPLPLDLASSLADHKIEISDPVSPDVVLDTPKKEYVLVECKASMFGGQRPPEKPCSQVRQARALLLLVPKVLASTLGLQGRDVAESKLMYLTRHDPEVPQAKGVGDIGKELASQGYETTDCGIVGLTVANDGIAITKCKGGSQLPSPVKRQLAVDINVHETNGRSVDAHMLYYLPWMPGASNVKDEYGQAVFGSRVLAAAAEIIGPLRPPCDARLEVDRVLSRATMGVYDRWHDKAVRRALREDARNLLKSELIRHVDKSHVCAIDHTGRGWSVAIADIATKSKIVEGLRKWRFDEKWSKPLEPSLFDSLAEEE